MTILKKLFMNLNNYLFFYFKKIKKKRCINKKCSKCIFNNIFCLVSFATSFPFSSRSKIYVARESSCF